MSARYFYLQFDLIEGEAEPLAVRQILQAACEKVFGESGSALSLDVLSVKNTDTGARGARVCVCRVRAADAVRARAALALAAPALRGARRAASLQALLMSVSRVACGPGGKDVVLVAAPARLAEPSLVALPEPAPAAGLILPDGSINWGCPCLGGMATGPCAQPFRDAFSCFHYSEAEPKGSDCYEKFSEMQTCMAGYPELYGRDDDDELALPGAGAGAEAGPGAGGAAAAGAGGAAAAGAGAAGAGEAAVSRP